MVFFFGFVFSVFTSFGQTSLYDKHYKAPPSLSLPELDSVRAVRIYETSAGAMNRDPIDKPGYLQTQVTFGEEQNILTYEVYNTLGNDITDAYKFLHGENNVIRIKQHYSSSPKYYEWTMRDTLISEIKLLKGAKQKLKFRWEYTYRDDTVLTSIVKYDKKDNVRYRMDFEYDEENKLTRKTVKERGKPARWLIATYDEQGNLIGYRNDDDRQSRYGSQVSIDRDSSDQITAINMKSRSGTNDRWVYEYNEDGKILKATLLNADAALSQSKWGEEKRRMEFTYDAQGNEVRWTLSEGETVKQRRDREYDDAGNMISEHFYRRFLGNLDLKYYVLFQYDEGNRLTRKDFYSKDYNQRKRWDYEYKLF